MQSRTISKCHATQVSTVPEPVETIVSSASNPASSCATTCRFIGSSCRVPRSTIKCLPILGCRLRRFEDRALILLGDCAVDLLDRFVDARLSPPDMIRYARERGGLPQGGSPVAMRDTVAARRTRGPRLH